MVSGSCAWTSMGNPKSLGRFPLTSRHVSPASSLRMTSQCFCMNRTCGRDGCRAMRWTQWPTSAAGQNGIELIDQAKSDAQGHFTINQEVSGPPHLLRTAFDGVTYNHMLPPGSPTTDLTLEVYNSSKQPGAAKVSKHMLFFEPSPTGQMTVQETYIYT